MIYENAELYNVQELITPDSGDGKWMSRVPDDLRKRLNVFAQHMMLFGAGSEIRFNIIDDETEVVLMRDPFPAYEGGGLAEVWFGPFPAAYFYGPLVINTQPVNIRIKKPANLEKLKEFANDTHLSFDPSLVRIRLPYDTKNRLISINGKISIPMKGQTPDRKIMAYGSSITQGASAYCSYETYAAKTAAELDADLISLGSAGSAFLEPEMAEYIAQRNDWDILTLELGANVIGQIDAAEFEKRAVFFLSTIAERNKDKWIFCTDMFNFIADFADPRKKNAFRDIIKDTVKAIDHQKLIYIRGTTLLTESDELSFDLVHPSPLGMDRIAKRLAGIIKEHTGIKTDHKIEIKGES